MVSVRDTETVELLYWIMTMMMMNGALGGVDGEGNSVGGAGVQVRDVHP